MLIKRNRNRPRRVQRMKTAKLPTMMRPRASRRMKKTPLRRRHRQRPGSHRSRHPKAVRHRLVSLGKARVWRYSRREHFARQPLPRRLMIARRNQTMNFERKWLVSPHWWAPMRPLRERLARLPWWKERGHTNKPKKEEPAKSTQMSNYVPTSSTYAIWKAYMSEMKCFHNFNVALVRRRLDHRSS